MKIMRFMRYDDVEIAINRDTISMVSPAGEGESYIERLGQATAVRVKAKFDELLASLEVEETPPTAAPKAEKEAKAEKSEKQSR